MARTVILGAGGHARALMDGIFHTRGREFVMTENNADVRPDDEVWIGVGDIATRKRLYGLFGHRLPDNGIQIMRGAVVYDSAKLGANVLVNTGAQIDHDCVIGDHCHIGPGAVLCGGVTLGEACFVGAGAIIVNGVDLADETFVPAGTLVCGPDDFRMPVRVVRN